MNNKDCMSKNEKKNEEIKTHFLSIISFDVYFHRVGFLLFNSKGQYALYTVNENAELSER